MNCENFKRKEEYFIYFARFFTLSSAWMSPRVDIAFSSSRHRLRSVVEQVMYFFKKCVFPSENLCSFTRYKLNSSYQQPKIS